MTNPYGHLVLANPRGP